MAELFRTAGSQAVISVAVLLVLTAVGWYLVEKFRGRAKDEDMHPDMLGNSAKCTSGGSTTMPNTELLERF